MANRMRTSVEAKREPFLDQWSLKTPKKSIPTTVPANAMEETFLLAEDLV